MEDNKAIVKKEKAAENITITQHKLVLQSIDRSRVDVNKWWRSIQHAEQIDHPNRVRLYDYFERTLMDGFVSGLIEKRVVAVINKQLHYEVNGKRVDEMDDLIQSEKFQLLMRRLWERKAWGITGIEAVMGEEFDFLLIPRKHIKPEKGHITEYQNGTGGDCYDYNELWNLYVTEDVERFGLLCKSTFYTILKTGNITDLAQYVEIFGQPIRKIKMNTDDPKEKEEVRAEMKKQGASTVVIMPDGAELEIIGDNITNGTGEVHERLHNICNNELAVMWLGNTESTGNQNGGSNAKAEQHVNQQKEIHKSDLRDMAHMLSHKKMQSIFKSFGFPVDIEKGRFVFEREFDVKELKERIAVDNVVAGKVPIGDDYWYDTYGIPKPDNYEELKKKMEEERQMKLNPPAPDPGKPDPNKKENPPKKPNNLSDDTWWQRFKDNLIDFFAVGR